MTDHLRNIALSVGEPDPGVFHWVLRESTEDATVFGELEEAVESFPSYQLALRAGVAALERLAQDLKTGPRAPGEDEDASPVSERARKSLAVPMENCGFSALPDEGAIDGD